MLDSARVEAHDCSLLVWEKTNTWLHAMRCNLILRAPGYFFAGNFRLCAWAHRHHGCAVLCYVNFISLSLLKSARANNICFTDFSTTLGHWTVDVCSIILEHDRLMWRGQNASLCHKMFLPDERKNSFTAHFRNHLRICTACVTYRSDDFSRQMRNSVLHSYHHRPSPSY